MLLPGTWSAALSLLLLSIICFGLWPNIFKSAGRWRFELFSIDFGLGAVLCALIAAYTLGTLGAELNFSDSMLVAGRRAEVMAVAAGVVFALGNLLYFATIALIGLTNGTLVTFSVFGCALGLLELPHRNYPTVGAGFLILAIAAGLAAASVAVKKQSRKGSITGLLAGLAFAGVWPVLEQAEPETLGIGAYGGVLLAAVGVLLATVFLDFFFLNISLEGGNISFANYLSGTFKDHAKGIFSGFVCAAGALALYTACTGTAGVTRFHAWITPFAGGLGAVLCGLAFWQKAPQPPAAKRNTLLSTALFAVGAAVLLFGMRK